ncbi:uncharacterized protein SCDLUD_004228 [Saccharomycodes ludwigii]|uniref:uncharacterized protein n=1 Tax=Saccharomycodes ludwigii TaxID=36035 RepID=UPI001E83A4FC|nr:hypothetical protein SCDLUD_004228 [Saccharomycodes ludwigii]KAH3899915.1 hypothetical protein SCDLUD_004228 [Saccharomycodes ludwigii]
MDIINHCKIYKLSKYYKPYKYTITNTSINSNPTTSVNIKILSAYHLHITLNTLLDNDYKDIIQKDIIQNNKDLTTPTVNSSDNHTFTLVIDISSQWYKLCNNVDNNIITINDAIILNTDYGLKNYIQNNILNTEKFLQIVSIKNNNNNNNNNSGIPLRYRQLKYVIIDNISYITTSSNNNISTMTSLIDDLHATYGCIIITVGFDVDYFHTAFV